MVRTDLAGDFGRHAENGSGPNAPIAEHAMVLLSAPVELDDGRYLPSSARCTVVFVHGAGEAYELEFVAPFHAVVTVSAAGLSPADGA